jgi:hypothetical protein
MAFPPTVLCPMTLPALLDFVLTSWPDSAPTTLIVCSGRDAFLQNLLHCVRKDGESRDATTLKRLMPSTLRNVMVRQHIKLVFCASVQELLAHLSTYCPPSQGKQEGIAETLILVGPLLLHAPTPSFSAQGLSRTFAAAVEAALRVGARLLLVEAPGMRQSGHHDEDEDLELSLENEGGGRPHPLNSNLDPWEQEVPILNDSARRFTSGSGERPWAGRTIKAGRVAARWFRFCKLQGDTD